MSTVDGKLLFVLAVVVCSGSATLEGDGVCERVVGSVPRTPGDNGFRIKISGKPEPRRYVPQQVYTVSIRGTYPSQRFHDVLLVAVTRDAVDESTTIGNFQNIDSLATSFSSKCPHVLTTVNSSATKEEMEVLWTAPLSGTGCMEFRATVVEDEKWWFKDDGALTLSLCEEETPGIEMLQAACCACGSAKYQMTFTSLWSPLDHDSNPIQGDASVKRLRWSNITGSTHSPKYAMWKFGRVASKGLREVCQRGMSSLLEEEMRQHIQDIRTVVKTTGIEWSDEYGMKQSRWSHFSVDQQNHLLSLVTGMSPNPGWCVGVSSLNLCLPNCTWIENTTIDLFPWTTGSTASSSASESGIVKPDKVQLIEEFVHANKAELPTAMLKIKRIYSRYFSDGNKNELQCMDHRSHQKTSKLDYAPQSPLGNFPLETNITCYVWSQWSECSPSCGRGTKRRQRLPSSWSSSSSCDVEAHAQSTQKEACYGECSEAEAGDCKLKEWSSWSECSCPSRHKRHPTRSRTRFFVVGKNVDSCKRLSAETDQEEICKHDHIEDCIEFWNKLPDQCQHPKAEGPCKSGIRRYYFDVGKSSCISFTYGGCRGNANRFPTKHICWETCLFFNSSVVAAAKTTQDNCHTRVWSQWSACSSTCGTKSFKIRTRLINSNKQKCFQQKRFEKQRCQGLPKCCAMDSWSPWTLCSQHSCLLIGVQERTRLALANWEDNRKNNECVSDLERRACRGVC